MVLSVNTGSSVKSANHSGSTPTSESGRIALLDIMRGFALFGIVFANIRWWSGWNFLGPEQQASLVGEAETAAFNFVHYAFVDGKFYAIFALLFGIGIAVQTHRPKAEKRTVRVIFLRRVLILFGIGLLHLTLVWDGDILAIYAVSGILVFGLRNQRDNIVFAIAIALLVTPVIGYLLFRTFEIPNDLGLNRLGDLVFDEIAGAQPSFSEIEWIRRPDFASFFAWTQSSAVYRVGELLSEWRLPKIMGYMSVGMLVGRKVTSSPLHVDRRRFLQLIVLGVAIGFPANLYFAYSGGGRDELLTIAATVLGEPAFALVYMSAICIVWSYVPRALFWLAFPGRTALTNYLIQSFCGIFLFYGIGFGLAGQIGGWSLYFIGLTVFLSQCLASFLWLRRFRFGPVEWLWRSMTYRKYIRLTKVGPNSRHSSQFGR